MDTLAALGMTLTGPAGLALVWFSLQGGQSLAGLLAGLLCLLATYGLWKVLDR